jgi:hypothetical protein
MPTVRFLFADGTSFKFRRVGDARKPVVFLHAIVKTGALVTLGMMHALVQTTPVYEAMLVELLRQFPTCFDSLIALLTDDDSTR